jgi:catechol 2,3-dioxygenase-like lactoylglutathione lyase family enzyme
MIERARFTTVAPQFLVHDVVKTSEYYQKKLGFTLRSYFLDPPVFAMLHRDGVELHFGKVEEGVEVQTKASARPGLGIEAYIWVSDIQALFEEYREAGVDIIEGPVKRVYGSTEIVIRDCNGFTLAFGD